MATKVENLTPEEVEEYLARIHYTGPKEATIKALQELQRCHIFSVPFENLSLYGREEIILTKEWLFEKVVRRRRGGVCYELNTMFSLLLDSLGFKPQKHAAQVYHRKIGTGDLGHPGDHVTLSVDIEGQLWLTDVGFGDAFWEPLPFADLTDPQEQRSGTYRIRKDGDIYVFEEKIKVIVDEMGNEKKEKEAALHGKPSEWVPRYQFDLIPRTSEDFHERLVFQQSDPRFRRERLCTLPTPWGRVTIAGNKILTTKYLGDNKIKKEAKELEGGEERVVEELEQKFGIRRDACFYPEGSMFYAIN